MNNFFLNYLIYCFLLYKKFKFYQLNLIMEAVNKKPEDRNEAFKIIVKNIYKSIKEDIMQA